MPRKAIRKARWRVMSRQSTRPTGPPSKAAPERSERPSVIHSSLYLPEAVHEALRKIAFDERAKIHDLVMEGLNGVLKRRGYPSVESLKAKTGKKP
jgi:hypothetical protein